MAGGGNGGGVVDLDVLPEIVGYSLRRAQVAIYQDFIRTIGGLDIRPAQFAAMVLVGANAGLSQTTLAASLGIDRSGVVTLIDALEARGLARRVRSATDRRTYAIELTADGQALLARLKVMVLDNDRRSTGSFSAEERDTLIALLRRLYEGRPDTGE